VLRETAEAIAAGKPVDPALTAARRALNDAGFAPIDYVALVDVETLEPLRTPAGRMRLIAAAKIGSTRLIDNLAVEVRQ
jgi:pantoate--beta-alanine ligase